MDFAGAASNIILIKYPGKSISHYKKIKNKKTKKQKIKKKKKNKQTEFATRNEKLSENCKINI